MKPNLKEKKRKKKRKKKLYQYQRRYTFFNIKSLEADKKIISTAKNKDIFE